MSLFVTHIPVFDTFLFLSVTDKSPDRVLGVQSLAFLCTIHTHQSIWMVKTTRSLTFCLPPACCYLPSIDLLSCSGVVVCCGCLVMSWCCRVLLLSCVVVLVPCLGAVTCRGCRALSWAVSLGVVLRCCSLVLWLSCVVLLLSCVAVLCCCSTFLSNCDTCCCGLLVCWSLCLDFSCCVFVCYS